MVDADLIQAEAAVGRNAETNNIGRASRSDSAISCWRLLNELIYNGDLAFGRG